MISPSKLGPSEPSASDAALRHLIEKACDTDPFKVEADLGSGFVKLCSSEAERRQAAQDIQGFEDIVIELLRNSRDAGAKSIFIATSKEADGRIMTIIDDGSGIPRRMWESIFEPRVTSKLETAHMDKWGMHGRGMALYSTKVNTQEARVVASQEGLGTSIRIQGGASLPEKADQSTFPHFEEVNGVLSMRGPKNIVRICCEFALEHRGAVSVYLGSPTQIVATLYHFGLATIPAFERAFGSAELPLVKSLSLANGPDDLATKAAEIGLDISQRSARRIMDSGSECLDDLLALLGERSLAGLQTKDASPRRRATALPSTVRLSSEERAALLEAVMEAFDPLAEAYYLSPDVKPLLKVKEDQLVIQIPLAPLEEESEEVEASS